VRRYSKQALWSMGIVVILLLLLLIARTMTQSMGEVPTATSVGLIQIMPTAITISRPSPTASRTATSEPTATLEPIRGIIPTPMTVEAVYAATQTLIAYEETIPKIINELNYNDFIIMPLRVAENVRAIFENGQSLGRNPQTFTRTGDSTIEYPVFFTGFDSDRYNLGDYTYLQSVINFYKGSFDQRSVSVKRGLPTWAVLDPMWAGGLCERGEHMLACEFRLRNPSIIFIRLGSNDRGLPDLTEQSLREIVAYSIEQGVIPILGTKADRFEGAANTTNQSIRQIAEDFDVPLWDFDLLAATLPNRGLGSDSVHLTSFYPYDWRQERGFTTGYGLHNLTGLIMLDAVWKAIYWEQG
jgi:hypothetical protein